MKKQKGFYNIEERDNGDIIWNGFPVEKIGGTKFKIIEKIYNISDKIRKVFSKTSNVPLKKLNHKDREIRIKTLESSGCENYKNQIR